MSRFLQLHILTAYPPSNPNRDDLGRPKTAIIGGKMRQRISSQALKRAIRTSEAFQQSLQGQLGERTQRLGEQIEAHLLARGADEKIAQSATRDVVAVFGKLEGSNTVKTSQLAFISPQERQFATELAERIADGESAPKDKDLAKTVLRQADGAVDIAMFGRMLADNPDFNREAAVQVAHAFTTNAVEVEDDYYTAVDDLKTSAEDAGAGFIGEAGYGAGVYYVYICVDRPQLLKNLAGDEGEPDLALAEKALKALVRAAATASPSGKRNSFANHVRPEFILAELGDGQPRNLASAFTSPVTETDQMTASITRLEKQRADFAKSYGPDWDEDARLHVGEAGSATLDDLGAFAGKGLEGLTV